MNRSVMVMEPLSKKSAQISESLETSKLTGGLNDAKNAGIVQKIFLRVRKGPKAPNPLSVKKKKVEATREPPTHLRSTKDVISSKAGENHEEQSNESNASTESNEPNEAESISQSVIQQVQRKMNQVIQHYLHYMNPPR